MTNQSTARLWRRIAYTTLRCVPAAGYWGVMCKKVENGYRDKDNFNNDSFYSSGYSLFIWT